MKKKKEEPIEEQPRDQPQETPVSAPGAPTPNADRFRITLDNLEDMFNYHKWDDTAVAHGAAIRQVLVAACEQILHSVPDCPLRTRALNNIFDARMLANAAITHHGVVVK